jgi:hypothetical protein
MAVAGWIFMSVWMWGLLMMTYVFIRDGGFHQFNPLAEVGVMALFWLFGAAGCGHSFNLPRTHISIENGIVRATEKWPWRRRVEEAPAKDAIVSAVIRGRDDEGDPYYTCTITLPSGRPLTFAESHDESRVEAARAKLLSALS